jgi:hypothetical protein
MCMYPKSILLSLYRINLFLYLQELLILKESLFCFLSLNDLCSVGWQPFLIRWWLSLIFQLFYFLLKYKKGLHFPSRRAIRCCSRVYHAQQSYRLLSYPFSIYSRISLCKGTRYSVLGYVPLPNAYQTFLPFTQTFNY